MSMAAKKSTPKKSPTVSKVSPPRRANPDAFGGRGESKRHQTQTLAKLVTGGCWHGNAGNSIQYAGEDWMCLDLVAEMKKAGDEAVAGDMKRVERMLTNQRMTLDAIFNNMAQRSHRQDIFKGIERCLMRLALKAQAQARATAETLSVIKNPMLYIQQANIAHCHQQVNKYRHAYNSSHSGIRSYAEKFLKLEPNKPLEADHVNAVDIGAQAQAGRVGEAVAPR
jgi:hypothetical protein